MTTPIPHFKPGQSVTFAARFTAGGLVDPGGVTLTIHSAPPPSGQSAVADVVVTDTTRDSQGRYSFVYVLPMDAFSGPWVGRWQATGTPPNQNGLEEQTFFVDPLDF